MSSSEQLMQTAQSRQQTLQLAYAGAFAPDEAAALLAQLGEAKLIDVRTRAELDWVGRPKIPREQYVHIEWSQYPGGTPNPRFIEQLAEVAQPDTPLLMLCRSAARSKAAAIAAAAAGYTHAYDVLEGFEGDKNADGHRKTVGGWCFRGLPWVGA